MNEEIKELKKEITNIKVDIDYHKKELAKYEMRLKIMNEYLKHL